MSLAEVFCKVVLGQMLVLIIYHNEQGETEDHAG